MKALIVSALLCAGSGLAAGGTTYYVDSGSGDDGNQGTAAAKAWKSLAKVNATTFQPGDRILLKSGSVWQGQLWPKGSGNQGAPISVDKFGGDKLPVINGAGEAEDAVKLYNQEYWRIANLEVTNTGAQAAVRRGVHLILDNYGTARDVVVSHLVVHDVNGDLKRKDNGGIIWSIDGAQKPSRFDGLTIEHCSVYHVDRSGIVARSYHARRSHWFPSLHVVIRHNKLDNIGGDGITPWACDGVLVEYNEVSRCNWRSPDYNAAVWPWSCDNSLFQYNEAYLTHGTKDGQGFDSDYNSRNTVFQYNYSHDNDGGFILICDEGSHRDSVGNVGTIVRYNISQNDGTRTFHLPGPVSGTKIYNNTIYIGEGKTVNLVQMSNWQGWPVDTLFANNIFYVRGTARYGHETGRFPDGTFEIGPGMGPARNTVFDGNVFFGEHVDRPEDKNAITADPKFVKPGAGAKGLASLRGYALRADSPAVGSGVAVAERELRDFFGTLITGKPDRGAVQSTGGKQPSAADRHEAWVRVLAERH